MSTQLRSSRRFAIFLILLTAAVLTLGRQDGQARVVGAPSGLPCAVDMRLLVISADGNESVLPAITETLRYMGTPFDLYIASHPDELTSSLLASGACHGRYQGLILTTGELGYFNGEGLWSSALSASEWATLRQYAATFRVRQATWYAYPQPQYGYNIGYAIDTALTPVTAAFTAEGAVVFSYLNTSTPLSIANAYTYLATPLGANVTPLLTTVDGHALALIHESPDGREHLSLTFDGNQHLLHSMTLGYGMVRWVTRGVFLGEHRAFMSPQVDDLLIHNDQWKAATPCGTPFESTGFQHRLTADDLQALLTWQSGWQSLPVTRALRLTIAFNGYGATKDAYTPDDLTPFVKRRRVKNAFHWVNHTFTHENLDHASAATTRDEIGENIRMAHKLRLPGFNPETLVTPDVSGLTNPTFLRIAFRMGIRYVVADTSRPGYSNPSPNTGLVNAYQPGIYMIPRYPNSLFFNVAAPEDWTAEYNCIYRNFWQRDLEYHDILDVESHRLLTYLLKGDANLWMFHQTNLDAYDGTHSLLGDLLDWTLAKYAAISRRPILSPPMHEIGELMQRRDAYNVSGARATWNVDGSVTIRVDRRAVVPVTGLATRRAERYGDDVITRVVVRPRTAVTITAE